MPQAHFVIMLFDLGNRHNNWYFQSATFFDNPLRQNMVEAIVAL